MGKSKLAPGSALVIPSYVNSVLKRMHRDGYVFDIDRLKAIAWVDKSHRFMPPWQYLVLSGQLTYQDSKTTAVQIIYNWRATWPTRQEKRQEDRKKRRNKQ